MCEYLPSEVVAEDQRLDSEAKSKQLELARLRWHWTQDETNPERVSINAYAKAIGRTRDKVGAMVKGYASFMAQDGVPDVGDRRSLGEFIEMAKYSETKQLAAEAIADTEGLRVDNVLSHRRESVRDLLAVALDASERRGTTVEEEITRHAENAAKHKEIEAKRTAEHKTKHTARWLSVEVKIGKAQRLLVEVLDETEGVEFLSDERELMGEALGKLRATLNLIDMRVVGTADIDWDAELQKMGGAR